MTSLLSPIHTANFTSPLTPITLFYNDQTLLNTTGNFDVNKIKTVIVRNFLKLWENYDKNDPFRSHGVCVCVYLM
jgi:hypothetical protein